MINGPIHWAVIEFVDQISGIRIKSSPLWLSEGVHFLRVFLIGFGFAIASWWLFSGHFNITAFQIKFARWINEECGAVIDCQLSRPLTSNNIVVNFRQNATNANTVVLLVFKDHCLPIDSSK